MNLLINCSNLKLGGGLQVAHSFIYELRNYPMHKYIVIYSDALGSLFRSENFDHNFIFIPYNIKVSWSGRNSFLNNVSKKYQIEKVFTVFGPTYWTPGVPHICGYAKPQYLYKDSPFFSGLSMYSRFVLKIKEFVHLHSLKQSNCFITENQDVSNRLSAIFPGKKVYTVTNYYHQVFENEEEWDTSIKLPRFEGKTLLTIAANYQHKNLRIIPEVILCLKKKYPDFRFRFVLTIEPDELGADLDDTVREHLVFLGKVHIHQCPYLYRQSDFMFLPTLLECFSASYPEAMYMGKPIITSGLDFAKGLCGHAALYVDTLSPENVADHIFKLSDDAVLCENLIKAGQEQIKSFDSYQARARKYLEIVDVTNE